MNVRLFPYPHHIRTQTSGIHYQKCKFRDMRAYAEGGLFPSPPLSGVLGAHARENEVIAKSDKTTVKSFVSFLLIKALLSLIYKNTILLFNPISYFSSLSLWDDRKLCNRKLLKLFCPIRVYPQSISKRRY